MKTKHTPGPWDFETDDYIVYFNGVMPIASIYEDEDFPCADSGVLQAEHEANGRLIAAAPDLLKALKDLLSVEICYDDDFVKAGLAAIKKAES